MIEPKFDLSIINPESIMNDVDQLLKQDNELSEELTNRIIDLSIDMPDIEFLFERDGIGCIPVGDLVALKGKAKAGKSTVLACLIAALFKGEYMGFKALKQGCKVLYIDTEQNPANTRRLTKKVHFLCGYPINRSQPDFIVVNLRGDNPDQRIKFIYEAIEKLNCDLLILDGAKDLILNGDINDIKTSGEVVQMLMTISKENHLSIVTVLHENKGDTNLRGHIGTEILNKCSENWQVKKDGDSFEVEQIDSRNQPTEGFSFTLNDAALPVQIEHAPKISTQERTETKKLETFRQCLPQMKSLSYTDLTNIYCEFHGCAVPTAKKNISEYCKKGYLIHESNGNYIFNYTSVS